MSNNGNTKKRRVEGGARVSIDGGGDNSSAELSAIKSTIDELVQQNRTQNENMASMLQLMKRMQGEMKGMRGEITQLEEKCDDMESSLLFSSADHRISIENKLGKMEANIMEKIDYHEILLLNQQWKYSAEELSDEYWDNNANPYTAKGFLEEMKKCTKEMRYGTGDTGIVSLNAHLPYDEEFLPHWKEFANALQQYRYYLERAEGNGSQSVLLLWHMELPDEVIDLLAKALKSTFFKRMALVGNSFGEKGINFALDYLENNHKLIEFGLVNNPIRKTTDIERLIQLVKTHPSIEDLAINQCFGSVNGYEMLKLIMTDCIMNKLRSLSLRHNDINTGGDTFISDFITSNSRLSSLKLQGNKLNDNDATIIAEALKDNTHLQILNIGENNFTNEGWRALSKAVFDKTSLNSAADSNHTCCIDFPENDTVEFDEVREINGIDSSPNHKAQDFDPIYVRQKKIYSIESLRNMFSSNVDHFDEDMPVEILPDMLTSIQRYSNYHTPEEDAPPRDPTDVKPISLVYEILQRWDKALAVFEALSS